MPSKFRLELDLVLDEAAERKAIESARQHHMRSGGVTGLDDQGHPRLVPANEIVEGTEQALMELLEHNPLLSEAKVEIAGVSCRCIEPSTSTGGLRTNGLDTRVEPASPSDNAVENSEAEDEFDEFEAVLYLCRWPNGDFSIVQADDKRDALVQLDEWAGAEPAWLVPLATCMVDFRLNDEGEIELTEFGEETAEFIWESCYPHLNQVLSTDDGLHYLSGDRKLEDTNEIRKAVEYERKRLWHVQGDSTPAKTALGRELQKRLRTVGPVADHYVELAATEILQGKAGEKGKPS
jgi:hypothetical protein